MMSKQLDQMNLDDTQKIRVRQWIQEGAKLAEIQSKLASEFGLRFTYMETRFLMDDLQLKPKDAEPARAPTPGVVSSASSAASWTDGGPSATAFQENHTEEAKDDYQEPGDVTVSVDQVTRAGTIVSGKVTFSDGKGADWYLDQFGRLGITPYEQDYKPSQADLMLFQGELQSELAKLGY
jgi:hypothetical protein